MDESGSRGGGIVWSRVKLIGRQNLMPYAIIGFEVSGRSAN